MPKNEELNKTVNASTDNDALAKKILDQFLSDIAEARNKEGLTLEQLEDLLNRSRGNFKR